MRASIVQLLALLVALAHGAIWVLASRLERPASSARLRAEVSNPSAFAQVGYMALAIPLLYPAAVLIVPSWAYEGPLNWSSRIDVVLQIIGAASWVVGLLVLVWSAAALGYYMGVDGVTDDHELVTSGPYGYVRHPVYTSFTACAAGLALVFRSYLLVAIAVVWLVASRRWAAAEEALLASPEGLGDAYRSYRERTGRFLPVWSSFRR